MTRKEIDIAIENSRTALLRIVLCWLAAAYFVRFTKKILPKFISRLVCDQLFKAEAAAGFLIIATSSGVDSCVEPDRTLIAIAKHYRAHGGFDCCNAHLSIETVIARLKAVRAALRRLKSRMLISAHSQQQTYFAKFGNLICCRLFEKKATICQPRPHFVPP